MNVQSELNQMIKNNSKIKVLFVHFVIYHSYFSILDNMYASVLIKYAWASILWNKII